MQESLSRSTQLLSPEAREALSAEVKRIAARCRSRDYNEEGIPMYLILEEVGEPERSPAIGSALHNALLASAAELAMEALEFSEIGPREIATVFEVLASQLFTMNAAQPLALTPTPNDPTA